MRAFTSRLHEHAIVLDARRQDGERRWRRPADHSPGGVVHPPVTWTLDATRLRIEAGAAAQVRARRIQRPDLVAGAHEVDDTAIDHFARTVMTRHAQRDGLRGPV